MKKFLILAMLLTMSGCGDDANEVDSGVDGDKKLSELSAEESKDFCQAIVEASIEPSGEIVCIVTSPSEDSCEACIDDINVDAAVTEQCDTLTADSFNSCEDTVEEVEDCINAYLELMDDILDDSSCADGIDESSEDMETPSECTSLSAGCQVLVSASVPTI